MRQLLPLVALLAGATAAGVAADVTIGRWNGMLVVTAPAGHDRSRLGGRLDQPITLDARDQSLTDTAEFLRRATGLNIVLAPALLAAPPVINLQVREMALGNLLSWLEKATGVHVGFVNGALYIADRPVAGVRSTRLYDVSDLALPIRDFPGPTISIPEPQGTGGMLLPAQEKAGVPRYALDELVEWLNRLISDNQ